MSPQSSNEQEGRKPHSGTRTIEKQGPDPEAMRAETLLEMNRELLAHNRLLIERVLFLNTQVQERDEEIAQLCCERGAQAQRAKREKEEAIAAAMALVTQKEEQEDGLLARIDEVQDALRCMKVEFEDYFLINTNFGMPAGDFLDGSSVSTVVQHETTDPQHP